MLSPPFSEVPTVKTSISVMITLSLLTLDATFAQDSLIVKLPPVSMTHDKPFMQALRERKSTREFRSEKLSIQDLSNLLWCANGVNRPDTKHRTVPTAMNKQDIDVYVVSQEGIYRYDPFGNALWLIRAGDFRAATGSQDFVAKAPVNLVYVSDYTKMNFTAEESGKLWMASIEAGHCSQNVYLYGAVAGLGVVVRASIDRERIATVLGLGPEQHVVLAQTVGNPLVKSRSDQ